MPDQPRDPGQTRDSGQPRDSGSEPTRYRTRLVSFTRRGGRLNERLQNAWDAMAEECVLDVPNAGPSTSVDPDWRFDAAAAFGREAPLVVEIGSGRGENVAHAAERHPDWNFLAVEVWLPGVAQTLQHARLRGLPNIRVAVVNAAELLATGLPDHSAHEIWTWFPDPWHKKKHNKRRIVTVPFTASLARVLEPGGTWRFATDWADYADHAARVVEESPYVEGGRTERFEGRVVTKFEAKGLELDRVIHDIAARPRPGADVPTLTT